MRAADSMVGVPGMTNREVQYHVLPDDPLAALNVLRQAARDSTHSRPIAAGNKRH
jgi:hypothetical protein